MGKFSTNVCHCEEKNKYTRVKLMCQNARNELYSAKTYSGMLESRYGYILDNCAQTFDMAEAPDLYAAMLQLNDKGEEELDGAIDRLDNVISSLKSDIDELDEADKKYHEKQSK
ncbi:hypothetical protein [Butyrivibrio sp. INlla14]|uniref:hypothetical protein n=1 Tax=Butyrivibrio sp. INlla14 TaxID=1520808 RepID=UPI00087625CE|nr:hypothetical protein [Butyrivibrio sp. INlla14]SCY47340.1 hypothetical protein SAMN02910371_02441 [Butyrivibrio sp. INlla14]